MTTYTSHRTYLLFILLVSLICGKIFFTANSACAGIISLFDATDCKARDGDTLIGLAGEDTHITVAAGATITLRNAVIINISSSHSWAGITLLGDATIILEGSNEVKGGSENYPGIFVPENSTLTIKGSGCLTASSSGNGAGIGGRLQNSCGNIVIDGGNITAKGGSNGAGIGGAVQGSCGNITINDGIITAQGGSDGAGIGGSTQSSCGNITINGGIIIATGGRGASGVGGGSQSSCGNISINCETLVAIGGDSAAGIGGGSQGSCGTITIKAGTIIASGGDSAAGIGGGSQGSCSTITINRGNITAKGGNRAAGIGSGLQGSCRDMDIKIRNTVTRLAVIKGNDSSDYIGASIQSKIGTVNIQNGTNIITY